MNRKKILFLIIFFFILAACSNKPTIVNQITGSDYKLWRKLDAEEAHRGTTTYYYFGDKGKFQVYKKYKKSRLIEKLDMGDVKLIEEWGLKDKNSIMIAGNVYTILRLNDSIFDLKNHADNQLLNLTYNRDILANE